MKKIVLGMALLLTVSAVTHAEQLSYTFDTDAEGFNLAWQSNGTIKQTHAAGGWSQEMAKEFSWGEGGGSANQQLAMQALANDPAAMISFDLMLDGTEFPAGAGSWYQFVVVGNSDGAAGWTQSQIIDGWHNADDPALVTWHFDLPFAQLGWQPGDTWFQFYTISNSDGAVPVNFSMDNFVLTPEPATLALLGLGALALRRRK